MILNRQRTVRVARPPLESFLRRVREQLNLAGADVTVCLVSDAEIARMNESFRKKKGPTDVLSFPSEDHAVGTTRGPVRGRRRLTLSHERRPSSQQDRSNRSLLAAGHSQLPSCPSDASSDGAAFLGDIAISPATARRNARIYHRSLPTELQILILHGVLHLLGYDHETDRGQMTRIENRLRRKLGLS